MGRVTQTDIDLAKLFLEVSRKLGRQVEPKYRALADAEPIPAWDVSDIYVAGVGPTLDFTPSSWKQFDPKPMVEAMDAGYNVVLRDFGRPRFDIVLRGGRGHVERTENLGSLDWWAEHVEDGWQDLFRQIRDAVAHPEVADEVRTPLATEPRPATTRNRYEDVTVEHSQGQYSYYSDRGGERSDEAPHTVPVERVRPADTDPSRRN